MQWWICDGPEARSAIELWRPWSLSLVQTGKQQSCCPCNSHPTWIFCWMHSKLSSISAILTCPLSLRQPWALVPRSKAPSPRPAALSTPHYLVSAIHRSSSHSPAPTCPGCRYPNRILPLPCSQHLGFWHPHLIKPSQHIKTNLAPGNAHRRVQWTAFGGLPAPSPAQQVADQGS